MRNKALFAILVLIVLQTISFAEEWYVPSREIPDIRTALQMASAGDTIVLESGVTYSGPNNRNIEINKSITIKSETDLNTPDWNIINSTIIDCGGGIDNEARAFTIQANNVKIIGITIQNGYKMGVRGEDASWGEDCGYLDARKLPPAKSGDNGTGEGYGGAIEITQGIPEIKYCIFKNNTVTGGQGGRGARGQDAPWISECIPLDEGEEPEPINDGQSGGRGGDGIGNGYGGAIAVNGGGGVKVVGCTFENCIATGGAGGRGGDGGIAASDGADGLESYGGQGGDSIGDGHGGAIYCKSGTVNEITDCQIINCIAKTGKIASGGTRGRGQGSDNPLILPGFPGAAISKGSMAGGAVYLKDNTDSKFVNTSFENNRAYSEFVLNQEYMNFGGYYESDFYWFNHVILFNTYKVGEPAGAIYLESNSTIDIDTCVFKDNTEGAIYCEKGSSVTIHNDYDQTTANVFSNNTNNTGRGFYGHITPFAFKDSDFYLNDADGNIPALLNAKGTGCGGAIFIEENTPAVNIQNTVFSNNTAYKDGGAIKSRSGLNIDSCVFTSNKANTSNATGYGGAMDIYYAAGSPLNFIIQNSSFIANESLNGGAISSEKFTGQISDCYFKKNFAKRGGALDFVNGTNVLENCVLEENSVLNDNGGAIHAKTSYSDIFGCQFINNKADGTYLSGNGGAVQFYGYKSKASKVKNCLFAANKAQSYGAAVSCFQSAKADVNNCTFHSNTTGVYGGAIFVDYLSSATAIDSIFTNNTGHAIHEGFSGSVKSNVIVSYSLFNNNPNGDFYDAGTGQVYNGPSGDLAVTKIPPSDPNNNNKYGDPGYASSPYGNYYLNQNGPAINNGSDKAVNKGLDGYTTNSDGASGDAGDVDRGFHYRKNADVRTYGLKLQFNSSQGSAVVVSPNPLSYNPSTGIYTYKEGDVVTIKATAVSQFRIGRWINTDNDTITTAENTTTMLGDKTVKVEFEHVRIIYVPDDYTRIDEAVQASKSGDTIRIRDGLWKMIGMIVIDKQITIESLKPYDPAVVASTIIDMEELQPGGENGQIKDGGPAFIFRSVGPDTVFNGITIRNFVSNISYFTSFSGEGWYDGANGVARQGGAMLLLSASPTIKNCIFEGCELTGGDGLGGKSGDAGHPNGGNGGWPGGAMGGAIACLKETELSSSSFGSISTWWIGWLVNSSQIPLQNLINKNPSSPIIQGCTFRNNRTIGGNGGDGGVAKGGRGGKGGGWYYDQPVYWEVPVEPLFTNFASKHDHFTKYTGRGGALYIGKDAKPNITDCIFQDNRSLGGTCGKCGPDWNNDIQEPARHFKIDNFGGAVFCDERSAPLFERCKFINNLADANLVDPNNDDQYISFGGAVACDAGSKPVFKYCHFEDNNSTSGGAIWTKDCTAVVIDSNFASNYAYVGAGVYIIDTKADFVRCNFFQNKTQTPESNDPNLMLRYEGILGDGGGLCALDSNTNVFDCNFRLNEARKAGGGIYIDGPNNTIIHNCLIAENEAGLDGGGISSNADSKLLINNCSIIDNSTTGTIASITYGGGVSCNYHSNVNIANSIIWGNFALNGPQVALTEDCSGFVDYSNIEAGYTYFYNYSKCTWGNHNMSGTSIYAPKFVEGYYLSQPDTGDSQQAALGKDNSVDTADPSIMTDPNKARFKPYRHTTRTDNKVDTVVSGDIKNRDNVDKGYHYILSTPLEGDLNYDGKVDMFDLNMFGQLYLSSGCKLPDFCNGADFNQDGFVNLDDFAAFSQDWQRLDTTPPMPNPPLWEASPTPYGSSGLRMAAVKAFDAMQGYNVFYKFERIGSNVNSGWIKQREFIDTGLAKDVEYSYRFKVWDGRVEPNGQPDPNNITVYSTTAYGVVNSQIPPTPGNFTAKAISSTKIDLTWTDTSMDELGFKIYRSLDGQTFVDINTVPADITILTDKNLSPSTKYYYRIKAYNQKGESDYSNIVSAITNSADSELPLSPTKLVAIKISDSNITLGWKDNSVNETSFVIERSVNSGPFSLLTTTVADVNSYVDKNLTYLTNYSYRVKARNSFGDSAWSNILNVTTLDPLAPLKPIILYNPALTPTDSNNSGQYHIGDFWHHKIVMKKAQLNANLYYKFSCLDNGGFSSPWLPANGVDGVIVPVVVPGYPAVPYPQPTVLYDAATNTITYDIVVRNSYSGFPYRWKVGASYSSTGTSPVWSSTIQMQ